MLCSQLLEVKMKTLNQLILENNIDNENLLYKVESWFGNTVTKKQIMFKDLFDSLVTVYQKRKFIDSKSIESAIEQGITNELEIRCFVDFICDNLNRQCDNYDNKEEINYLYMFKKIIQLVAVSTQN